MTDIATKEEQKANLKEMAEIVEKITGDQCSKCYGRGYDGFEIKLQAYTPCVCILKSANKIKQEKLKEIREGQEN
jgi:hypothetical protein